MPSYEPLTPSQLALLHEIEASPIVMTIAEEGESQRGKDLQYLIRVGLLSIETEFIAQEVGRNRYRYSRSDKPLD